MDFDTLVKWMGVVGGLLGIVNIAWTLVGKGSKGIVDKLEKNRVDLIDHDRRIQALESELKHIPSAAAFTDLRVAVTKLEGHLSRLDDAVGRVSATVRSIDNYLRDETKA